MEAKFTMPPPGLATGLRLHDLVSELTVVNTLKLAANRNIMVNELPPDIMVQTELSATKTLLGKIITMLAAELTDSLIRVSAKVYTSIVLIHFREYNIDNASGMLEALMQLVPEAEKMGSYIGITTQENGAMTIVVSILNKQEHDVCGMQRLAALVSSKRSLTPNPIPPTP